MCDNGASGFAGRCYTVWTDVPSGRLTLSTSLDGGVTWGAAVGAAGTAPGNGALPLVLPNATLVVPYRTFGALIATAISADGGATLTPGTVVGPAVGGAIPGFRSPPLPSGEVGGDGRIHLAWHTCAFRSGCTGQSPSAANDLALASSADGVTWTQPQRLELASGGASRLLPGLGVDAASTGTGTRLGLVHYEVTPVGCAGDACSIRPLFTYSSDAGATWSRPLALASPMRLSWLAATSQGRMLGDYFSTSFVGGGVAVPVFTAARAPQGPLFRQDLYSASIGPLPAARPLTLSARRLTVWPRSVRADAVLRATLGVRRSDLGARLDGRATCSARMRGRALPVLTSRTRGLVVECSWRIPRGRVGPVVATIGVRVDDASVARRFRVA
ncbi:MAG TPA: hypothetical protein VM290_01260 [Gaiellaceae bacterium]|nr:hypothetical protein [Gaiellaceae bacterium]